MPGVFYSEEHGNDILFLQRSVLLYILCSRATHACPISAALAHVLPDYLARQLHEPHLRQLPASFATPAGRLPPPRATDIPSLTHCSLSCKHATPRCDQPAAASHRQVTYSLQAAAVLGMACRACFYKRWRAGVSK